MRIAHSPLHPSVTSSYEAAPHTTLLIPLAGLARSTSYEVRLSYPAWAPAVVEVGIAGAPRAAMGAAAGERRLLNTAKAVLRLDDAGDVEGFERGVRGEFEAAVAAAAVGDTVASSTYWLAVRVEREGVASSRAAAAAPVPFNVILDPLVAGAVPSTVVRLGGAALVAVALIAAAWAALRARGSPYAALLRGEDKPTRAAE